jgi:hypothetical protein
VEPYEVFLRRIFVPEISECFIQEEIDLEIRNSRSNQDKQIYLDFKPETMNKQEIARQNMIEVGILEGKNGVSGNLHIRNHPVSPSSCFGDFVTCQCYSFLVKASST